MPSGKRARQQRQQAVAAPPPVRSTGGPGLGARQASARALAIAGGVILLVIVAVVLAIVLSQGSSNTGSGDGPSLSFVSGTPAIGSSSVSVNPNAAYNASTVAALFKGIPQHGFVLGQPNAPVTLIEFIDLQCPVCDQFELTELQPLIDTYVRPGKIKIEMKAWNIIDANDHTDDSLRGQKALYAASQQNKAFNFASVVYENQKQEGTNWMTDATMCNFAASVDGLDTRKFIADANSPGAKALIRQVTADANALQKRYPPTNTSGFNGTPGIFLAKGNSAPTLFNDVAGYPDLNSLEAAINALIK